MSISTLKQQLMSVLPLLVANRDSVRQGIADGELARSALDLIQSRLDTAYAVMRRDNLSAAQGFKSCAILTIDLRAAVRRNSDERQRLDAWLECFRSAGYTAVHPMFNVPVDPEVGTVLL